MLGLKTNIETDRKDFLFVDFNREIKIMGTSSSSIPSRTTSSTTTYQNKIDDGQLNFQKEVGSLIFKNGISVIYLLCKLTKMCVDIGERRTGGNVYKASMRIL